MLLKTAHRLASPARAWVVGFTLFAVAGMSAEVHAYSYAAAGKEPLIEGRELLLNAAQQHDKTAMQTELTAIHDELLYLEQNHHVTLIEPLAKAAGAEDQQAINEVMALAYKAEIERRLEGAVVNIKDYQTAKVLVVKSKQFLDLLQPMMDKAQWDKADAALRVCLDAIGNPGVFGVGTKAADPDAFTKAEKDVMTALGR
ncbi:hypothetical protein [Pokkaliibacter plantistimulans]|nr:hypothetical protein [Pokkaliibacter plantistimulans]